MSWTITYNFNGYYVFTSSSDVRYYPQHSSQFRVTSYGFSISSGGVTTDYKLSEIASPLKSTTKELIDAIILLADNSITQDPRYLYSNNKIPGYSTIHKFGSNPSVGTTEAAIVPTGVLNWLTAASAVRVRAGGNANDTAAGTGAQILTVVGLDQNWANATADISLAGALASSPTTVTFIRVFRVYVKTVGTYTGANTGAIILETTGGTFLAQINAGAGQGNLGVYTVPAGYTAYIMWQLVNVEGSKSATMRFKKRSNADDVTGPSYEATGLVNAFSSLVGNNAFMHQTWESIPEKTDLWFTGFTGTGTAGVDIQFEILLTDNSYE